MLGRLSSFISEAGQQDADASHSLFSPHSPFLKHTYSMSIISTVGRSAAPLNIEVELSGLRGWRSAKLRRRPHCLWTCLVRNQLLHQVGQRRQLRPKSCTGGSLGERRLSCLREPWIATKICYFVKDRPIGSMHKIINTSFGDQQNDFTGLRVCFTNGSLGVRTGERANLLRSPTTANI